MSIILCVWGFTLFLHVITSTDDKTMIWMSHFTPMINVYSINYRYHNPDAGLDSLGKWKGTPTEK